MSTGDDDKPKTPPQTLNYDPLAQPMPQSQGTAANTESRQSEMSVNSATCSFEDMLIAFIAMSQCSGRLGENEAHRARESAAKTLSKYLEDAAAYVNGCLDGNIDTKAQALRDAIKE